MGMSTGGGGGAKSDINVTPLVDVCLVLLIIFMVMVPRNVPEISVRIPPESKMKRPPVDDAQKPLVIGLTADGAITLNQRPMEESELGAEITRQLEFRDKKAIFVDFEDKAKYGKAVELVDLAKKSGAEVVGVMKKKDEKIPDTLKEI
jgi:biopolymer transport protein ExbD